MKLNELKKSMSTLEQVLAKTNTDIKINVSASKTAQTKILKEFRKAYTSLLLVAIIFVAAAIYNINPISFPLYLKIYLSSFLAIGAIWYIYLYRKLKSINIAVLSPKQLFSKTATIKLLTLSGEIFIGMCLVFFFALLLPSVWTSFAERMDFSPYWLLDNDNWTDFRHCLQHIPLLAEIRKTVP